MYLDSCLYKMFLNSDSPMYHTSENLFKKINPQRSCFVSDIAVGLSKMQWLLFTRIRRMSQSDESQKLYHSGDDGESYLPTYMSESSCRMVITFRQKNYTQEPREENYPCSWVGGMAYSLF